MSQKATRSKRRSKPESTLRSTLSLTALAPNLAPPAKKQKTKAVTSVRGHAYTSLMQWVMIGSACRYLDRLYLT